jgi:hypothetical protein
MGHLTGHTLPTIPPLLSYREPAFLEGSQC